MKRLFLILLLAFSAGCYQHANQRSALQQQFDAFEKHNIVRAASYVDASRQALDLVPKEHQTREVEVAQNFNEMALVNLPKPDFTLEIDIRGLLSTNAQESAKATASVEKLYNEDKTRLDKMDVLEKKINIVTELLVKKGGIYEEQQRKTAWFRFWTWSTSTLVIAGIICLFVFCPAAIPVVLGAIRWILSKFVGLIAYVVPALVNTVKGLGEVRKTLKVETEVNKTLPPDKQITYKPEEALELLDTELKIATDSKDKEVIDKLRKKENV